LSHPEIFLAGLGPAPLLRARWRTKDAAKSLARRLGYEVHSIRGPGELAARELADGEHYHRFHSAEPVFAPWDGHPDFEILFQGVEPHTIVSRDRCYMLAGLAHYAGRLDGDAAECGVYNGGTALLLSRVLAGQDKRLFLFDSFEGLPGAVSEKDGAFLQAGEYAADNVESVRRLLAGFEGMTEIRKGWIPETFAGLEERRYAIVHIDVDRYQSTLDCCTYFYPRLVAGGILLFDDYGFAGACGERYAADEFFADKPESPLSLPTGQAMVLKLPAAEKHQG
jgi:O-methyltransferase